MKVFSFVAIIVMVVKMLAMYKNYVQIKLLLSNSSPFMRHCIAHSTSMHVNCKFCALLNASPVTPSWHNTTSQSLPMYINYCEKVHPHYHIVSNTQLLHIIYYINSIYINKETFIFCMKNLKIFHGYCNSLNCAVPSNSTAVCYYIFEYK